MGLPVCQGAAGCLFGADQITVITGLARAVQIEAGQLSPIQPRRPSRATSR